jgi:dTDP-4-amino-4,6-dideoxygalactose transaminase
MTHKEVLITKSFLPPIDDYIHFLEKIWTSNQLTNNGPLVQELESQLKAYLGVKHLFLICNGTIALQIAIKALDLKNEVITTPFSYVATTSSLIWEGCQPVFVDIDPSTLCIDPNLIEAAITDKTTAILATHVFGIPCDVGQIKAIAEKHQLKVLYDAAHTFGGKYLGQSIVSFGDAAILSFHATKLFHTIEGGAVITDNEELAHRISYMRNFGHKGQEDFWGLGINGKNSEFHAAMGLCNLRYIDQIIASRKQACQWYDKFLETTKLSRPAIPQRTDYNFGYYPILLNSEAQLLEIKSALSQQEIYPRRYFYPSLNTLPITATGPLSISDQITKRVLCLPLFADMDHETVKNIAETIMRIIT